MPDIEIAEPKTVVPTKPSKIASSLVKPNVSRKFKNNPNSPKRTMKDVPLTGSIPVSPITLTAIAPNKKVAIPTIIANKILGIRGKPPTVKINDIATNEIIIKIGK